MAKRKPKALVIDTSVACATGRENAAFPTSIRCRDFLVSVLKHTFLITMSSDIYTEWRTHASGFSHKWLVQMYGRRRVAEIGDVKDAALRNKILRTSPHQNVKKEMEKDCLLLEAALATDKIIFSLDENVRHLFHHAAATVSEIKSIHWANPELSEDDVTAWLSVGLLADKKRQLELQQQ